MSKSQLLAMLFFATSIMATKDAIAQQINGIQVPLLGNSWLDSHQTKNVYVYFAKTGQIKIEGIGSRIIDHIGYQKLPISKTIWSSLKDTNQITISGSAIDNNTAYVKNNEDNYFYWGRRGPSVHLNYDVSAFNDSISWFYTELEVPIGMDPIGSYFMANGFGEGYFGMQVNSAHDRRILFSIWSPFNTDDPSKIPLEDRIQLIEKGPAVYSKSFGNEGAGGQSYLTFNWVAGNTYKFLIHALPTIDNHTQYSAYFFAPELNKWQLIASFDRPKTNTYLKKLHSFLENFEPNTGNIERKAYYKNQWICTKSGQWHAIQAALFTGDATAKKAYRLDYSGGIENGKYFLRNCGFFNNNTPLKTVFQLPTIDSNLNQATPNIPFVH